MKDERVLILKSPVSTTVTFEYKIKLVLSRSIDQVRPYATVTHVQSSVWALVFAILGILLLLGPRSIPARWLCLIMFLPLIMTESKKPETGSINLTVLDVG